MKWLKKDIRPRFEELQVLAPHGFIRVAYAEWGPREAEQTVVCVHGLTRNGRDFDFLGKYLAAQGIRVVAPDLPGRGRSEWLPKALDYATPAYLAVMGALLARLNVSEVDWVGTSLGGHIGMEFAAQSSAPVRRLVLNDFGARVEGAGLHRLCSYMRLNQRFNDMDEAEQYFRTVYEPFGALTDSQWRHMVEHSVVPGPEGEYRFNYDPAISAFFVWPKMLDISLWHVWERVECPVLIMRGETSDLLHIRTVERMKRRGAAASKRLVQSVEIPDCGHAPSLMMLDQMRLIEEFLTRDELTAQARQA